MRALQLASTALRRHRWVGLGLTLSLVLALGGSLASLLPGRAHAATVTVTTCTESALKAAVAAASPGDTVHFGCSGTITLTSTLAIAKNLTLDGTGHDVTLDGNHSVRVLSVASSVNFTLNHLTVANGLAAGSDGRNGSGGSAGTPGGVGQGGGLFSTGGTLTLTNCTFTGNNARGGAGGNGGASSAGTGGTGANGGDGQGGGLYSTGGTLTLTNCTLTGNIAQGGAAGSGGTGGAGGAGGVAGSGIGGGFYHTGVLTIDTSTFASNTAQGGAGGAGGAASSGGSGVGGQGNSGGAGQGAGGFYVVSGSFSFSATVTKSTIASNTAQGGAGGAGGAGGTGAGSSGGNGGAGGPADGGGLFRDNSGSSATITVSTIASNTAQGGAGGPGGDGSSAGGLGGSGGFGLGGGLYTVTDGAITFLYNSTVADNSAHAGSGGRGGNASSGTGGGGGDGGFGQGGGIYSIFGSSSGEDSPAASTVAGNTVQGGAGGAGGAGSSGSGGGGSPGIAEGLSIETVGGGDFFVISSILSSGPGANCAGHPLDIFDAGGNLDSGTSCHFTFSLSNTDPLLGPLANNGGPTQTLALLPGSPAIDEIFPRSAHTVCPLTDQRGVSRPQPPFRDCDIGAYEFVPTTTTSLTANPNPGLLDQPVQLCATVKPTNNTATPTGSVSFQEGATTLGYGSFGGPSHGNGCFTTSSLSLGDHSITASYSGSGARGFSGSTSAPLVVSIQVQGQDVAGGGTGGGGTPPYTPPQSQDTGGQNAAGNGAGQTQQHQRTSPQPSGVPWLGTGLGLLLLLLGLGGLGGVFYRASRRRPALDTGSGAS